MNDGSGSKYDEYFERCANVSEHIIVLKHAVNCGKERALKTAYNYYFQNKKSYDQLIQSIGKVSDNAQKEFCIINESTLDIDYMEMNGFEVEETFSAGNWKIHTIKVKTDGVLCTFSPTDIIQLNLSLQKKSVMGNDYVVNENDTPEEVILWDSESAIRLRSIKIVGQCNEEEGICLKLYNGDELIRIISMGNFASSQRFFFDTELAENINCIKMVIPACENENDIMLKNVQIVGEH